MHHLECQTIDMSLVFNMLYTYLFKDSVAEDNYCWRNTTVWLFFDKNVQKMTGFWLCQVTLYFLSF